MIRISFSDGVLRDRAELNQRRLGVVCRHESISGRFAELIALFYRRFKNQPN